MNSFNEPAFRYHDYQLFCVFEQTTPDLRTEIVDFWIQNGALDESRATEERARQVVVMIRDDAKHMVGVSTVYVAELMGNPYYFYRMYIKPGNRAPGMMRFVTLRTRELLEQHYAPGKPSGMVIITENRKLMRPGMKRMFSRNGYQYMGRGPRGNDIWVSEFQKTMTDELQAQSHLSA